MVRILSQLLAAVLVLAAAGVLAAKVNILGFWWENPIPFQHTPKNLKSIRAEDCAACHAEIYKEWKASTHAQALSDLQFQAEMSKSPRTNWLCLNCHTPLRNQMPVYADSVNNKSAMQPVLVKNPANDPVLRAEAVTCAVCHVRDGAIIGPTGSKLAPHPVKKDPEMLQASCGQCHQATADYGETLICTFDTYQEWKTSPYAAKGQTCASCHMPVISRPVAAGGPTRQVHRHTFGGGLIPKTQGEPAPAHRSGLSVQIVNTVVNKDNVMLQVRLKNAEAGHKLPTGDPERHIRVDVKLFADGKPVGARSIRIGQQWEWYPKPRRIADTRLKPMEERIEKLEFPIKTRGAFRAGIVVTNVRMTQEAAKYHQLLGRYPLEARVQNFNVTVP